jgi:DNA-directed RNA polymerase subunit RPC12/RpoP
LGTFGLNELNEKLTKIYLSNHKNAYNCAYCGIKYLLESNQNVFRCTSCNLYTCRRHGKETHKGMTCDEFDKLQDEKEGNAAIESLKKLYAKCEKCNTFCEKANDDECVYLCFDCFIFFNTFFF